MAHVSTIWCVVLTFLPAFAHGQSPVVPTNPAKLSIDALRAGISTPTDVQFEMNGVQRVELTEVSEGLYQLNIWGKGNAPCFRAILPFKWAVLAQRSKRLFVSVKDGKTSPPTLAIYGNEVVSDGASTEMKIVWMEPRS